MIQYRSAITVENSSKPFPIVSILSHSSVTIGSVLISIWAAPLPHTNITFPAIRQLPNYTAWWQRHRYIAESHKTAFIRYDIIIIIFCTYYYFLLLIIIIKAEN